jgi:hypothetical protein
MKTDRLTLLISPADKAAINARAEMLGISVSELVRQAALGYDPEEARAKEELEALLPDFHAAVDRMNATFDRMLAKAEAHDREMERLQSPEYREEVRRHLEANPDVDWDWIAKVRSGALHGKARAA